MQLKQLVFKKAISIEIVYDHRPFLSKKDIEHQCPEQKNG